MREGSNTAESEWIEEKVSGVLTTQSPERHIITHIERDTRMKYSRRSGQLD
jgi:hypothetical protein